MRCVYARVRLALCLAALLCGLLFAITPASAQRSIECQKVWDGPTADNDFVDCLKNSSRIGSQWKYYVLPGFAAVIFLFTIIGLPIIFSCHCCCCESCCGCCTSTANPARSRCWLWMWIIVAIVFACSICVLIIYGADSMMKTANQALDDFSSGPLDYFNETKNEIVTLMTDYSTTPPTPPDVDLSVFDEVDDTMRDKIHLVRHDYFKYFNIARIVSYCIGAVGVLFILLILIFACCRVGGCCPVAFSGIYFFFAVIYSLAAILFTVGIYAANAGCGEVTLQYKREPGVMQWYVVPWCEEKFNFTSLRNEVDAEVLTACHDACSEILKYCDNDEAYPGTNSDHIFMCGKGITSADQCTSLDFVSEVLLQSYVKPILSNTLCSNTTGWTYQEKCTPVQCETRCKDYDTPDIKAQTWSKQIVSSAQYALNASTALSYVRPMMDCNFIIDRLASAVETEKNVEGLSLDKTDGVSHCSTLHISMIMLGSGFFVGALMFLLGIYILHAGSWMWVAKPTRSGSRKAASSASAKSSDKPDKDANGVKE